MKEDQAYITEGSCECDKNLFLAVTVFSDRGGQRHVLEQCQECGIYRSKNLGKLIPPDTAYYDDEAVQG